MKLFSRFALILFTFVTVVCYAAVNKSEDVQPNDRFVISFVNAKKGVITIGGASKQKGDTFLAKAPIQWQKDIDYICARNQRTRVPYKISAKTYRKASASSINDFIRKRYTCDKGADKKYSKIGKYLSRYPWDMIDDEIAIPITLPLDDSHILIFSSIPGNKKFFAEYDTENGIAYITKEALDSAKITVNDLQNTLFHVEYIADDEVHGLTDNFIIQYFNPNSN